MSASAAATPDASRATAAAAATAPPPSFSVVDPAALYARLCSDARFGTIRSAVDRTSSVSVRDIDELVAFWRARKMTLPSWIAPYFLEVESKITDRDVEAQAAKNRAAGHVPSRTKKSFKICTRLNDPRPSNKHCGGSLEQQLCESVCRCVICGSDKHGAFQKETVAAAATDTATVAANDDRKTDAAAPALTAVSAAERGRSDAESKDQSDSSMPPSGSPSTGSVPLSRTASSENPVAAPVTLTRSSSTSKATTRFLCPFQSNYDSEVRELTTAEGWINIKETLAHIGEVTAWRRAEIEKTRVAPERTTRATEPRRWAAGERAEVRRDRSSDRGDSATDASAQPATAAAAEDDDSWTTVPVRESRSKKPVLETSQAASETSSKLERGSSLSSSKEGTAAERERWRRERATTASAAAPAAAPTAAPSAAPAAQRCTTPAASAPTAPWANPPRPPSNPAVAASDAAPPGFVASVSAPASAPAPVPVPYLAPSASESRWAGWSSGGAPVAHAAAPAAAAGPYFASSALSGSQPAPAQWSDSSISQDIAAWSLAATAATPARGYVSPPAPAAAAALAPGQMASQSFVPRFSNAPVASARSFVDPAAATPAASSTAGFFAGASPPLASHYSMGGGLFFEQQSHQPQPPLAFAPSMWSTNGAGPSAISGIAPPSSAAAISPFAVAPPSSHPRAPVVAVKMASAPYVPANPRAAMAPVAAGAVAGAAVAAPKLVMCPVPFANQRMINPRLTLNDACLICRKSLADPTHHPAA